MNKITRDNCGDDLMVSDGVLKYRLTLSCKSLPHVVGVVLDVMVYPPIYSDHHFCNLGCLRKWLEK